MSSTYPTCILNIPRCFNYIPNVLPTYSNIIIRMCSNAEGVEISRLIAEHQAYYKDIGAAEIMINVQDILETKVNKDLNHNDLMVLGH